MAEEVAAPAEGVTVGDAEEVVAGVEVALPSPDLEIVTEAVEDRDPRGEPLLLAEPDTVAVADSVADTEGEAESVAVIVTLAQLVPVLAPVAVPPSEREVVGVAVPEGAVLE